MFQISINQMCLGQEVHLSSFNVVIAARVLLILKDAVQDAVWAAW